MGLEIDPMFSGSKAHVLKHDTLLPSSVVARCCSPFLSQFRIDSAFLPIPPKGSSITELVD